MRSILLCVSILLIGIASNAQSNTASLNITLTDVQSVTFNSAGANDVDQGIKGISQNGSLKVLSNSTSQIKKISSGNSEYGKIYKEFYAGNATRGFASSNKNSFTAAVNSASTSKRPKGTNGSNLVIYQIDPR